jgi:hypothetical protein
MTIRLSEMEHEMVNKPKAIGTACETATVRYLVPNGFGGAERPALHGSLDEGDITGTPGVGWEVKGGHAAETASDAQIAAWLLEAEIERVNRGADVGVLVLKRKGKGAASAGQWWAFLPGWAFIYLAHSTYHTDPRDAAPVTWHVFNYGHLPAVRITLAEVVTLLRRAGYGDPLEASA